MAGLDPEPSYSPERFPRPLGDDSRNITVVYILAHLRDYIPEIKHSDQKAEGWEAATDYALLDPFHRKLDSLCLGYFWLLYQDHVSSSLGRPSGLVYMSIGRLTHGDSKKYGYSMPIRVRIGPLKLYLVSGADNYLALFSSKASRCMNTKAAVLLALENLFGTPSNIIPFYAADNSGVNSTPVPWSRVKPEHRITYLQTRAAHKYLSGPGLAHMTEFYLNVLKQWFQNRQIGSEWVDHPDLYRFLQDTVFRAAVEAMCGQHLLAQSPTFVDDFWEFVDSVPTLIKGLPRWLSPRPYRVRGRLLDAIKRWHNLAHAKSDSSKIGADDPEWDPYFGSKLIRARQEYSRNMPFLNVDALAAEDLGLLFA